MSSKRYPDEFKIEAVKQVVELGYPVAEVAKRLGITTHSLYAWKKKFGPDSVEHNEKLSAEKEIRQLKKELKRVF
jgi:transposase